MNSLMAGLIWTGCAFIGETADRYFSWLNDTIKKVIFVSVSTLVYVILVFTAVVTIWNFPSKGFNPGIIEKLGVNDYLSSLIITLIISSITYGRSFLLSWKNTAIEAESLKKEQAEARFETLKHQTNPHFLFNSLNVLTTLVHKDADQAEEFVRQLSSVYRYVLDNRNVEVVPIRTELEAIKAYAHLMKIRFEEGFNLEIKIEDHQQLIPPMTLQLLVENALKHNVASQKKPIYISITEEVDFIKVRNNLQVINIKKDSTGLGLSNIIERYKYLTDQAVEVVKTESHFEVRLPKLTEANL
jgi:LytS/YehU family sensor histidine kinase